MSVEWIRSLYAYSRWANGRVLDAAAKLDASDLLADRGPGAGSIRDTVAHTMLAQAHWLRRWQGNPRSMIGDVTDCPDVAAIRAAWEPVDDATAVFLNNLDDGKLAAPLHYFTTAGQPYAEPLWQQLLHQVNHATQHRSEAAYFLSQAGHSPGDLDYVRYLRQRE